MYFAYIFIGFVLIGQLRSVYLPGEPGAAWSKDDLIKVRGKLYSIFRKKNGSRNAAKSLRLTFHDCLKYADGTGGCDGCLNWEGVDTILDDTKYAYNNPIVEGTNNKGLEEIVDELEKIYKDASYPPNVPAMKQSLYETGKSRADLWSYAGIVAVEFSMGVNNIACQDQFDERVPTITCMHKLGDDSCQIQSDKQIQFQHGRIDCQGSDPERPYITDKEESHPSPVGNGKQTIEFFKKDFNFNGRETAAIFGAHTLGRFTITNSLFPYIWTSAGTHTFNNDYYKVITGEDRMFFDDPECRATGDAFGNKMVKTQWLAHSRKMDKRGGPTFWIHRSYICPPIYSPFQTKYHKTCYENVPEGQECIADPAAGSSQPRQPDQEDDDQLKGCERFRIIMNRDEMAMNCEMGLYRDFEVTDGVLHGCVGLEVFNKSMPINDGKEIWSKLPGQKGRAAPECKLQELAEPAGSQPLHKIMEEFAADQTSWVNAFIPAMEKMMRNGYDSLEDSAVDRFASVDCPIPNQDGDLELCYELSEATGPTFMIGNKHWKLEGKVLTYDSTQNEFIFKVSTGAPNQLWRWSESGSMLINMATNKPFKRYHMYEWRAVKSGDFFMLANDFGSVLNCKSAKNEGKPCGISKPWNSNAELFNFIEV